MNLWKTIGLLAFAPALLGIGCSSAVVEEEGDEGDSALAVEEGPADVPGSATEVWSIQHKWSDINAATGKTYDMDYVDWVAGLGKTKGFRFGETLELHTPPGAAHQRTLAAPTLECADTALFARVAFASMNHLPFYVKAGDVYAGHFGIIKKDGSLHPFGQGFKRLADFEPQGWREGQPWPSDKSLRSKHIVDYKSGDDTFVEATPGTPGGGGAWFDEFFLNKRVGYFLISLVSLFGSTNLAEEGNLFHIKPEATRPGDALLHRHGKYAPIGHTLFVYQSRFVKPGRMEIEVVSGSMPARQATWAPHYESRGYFLSEEAGGEKSVDECRTDYSLDFDNKARCRKELSTSVAPATGCVAPNEKHPWEDGKCIRYAYVPSEKTDLRKMGGGIRRFRNALLTNGHWQNIVPTSARDIYIADTDLQAIGARTKQFEQLLSLGSVQERKDAALATIKSYREYIRTAPSTCSKRTSREEAFEDLYRAYSDDGEFDKAKIDKEVRILEDYVFAELDYDSSKTCCWNSTKREHFDTIMSWAKAETDKATAAGTCAPPPVFKAQGEGDGYQQVRAFARSKGLPFPDAWTEDEPCKAKNIPEDTLTGRAKTPTFCSAPPAPANPP